MISPYSEECSAKRDRRFPLRHAAALSAVIAGKIDYPSYRFFDRLMIRLILSTSKGPMDLRAVVELIDWHQVEVFGRVIGDT